MEAIRPVVRDVCKNVCKDIGGSAGRWYLPQTKSLIARMEYSGAVLTTGRKNALNTCIKSLIDNDLFDTQFDVLVIEHGVTNGQLQNWVGDNYDGEGVNNPTMEELAGSRSDGTSSYIRTHYNPKTNGLLYQKDDACKILVIDGINSKATMHGCYEAVSKGVTFPFHNIGSARINGGAFYFEGDIGFNCISRYSSNLVSGFINETKTDFTSGSLDAPSMESYEHCGNNAGTPYLFQEINGLLKLYAYGKSITQTKFNLFRSIITEYFSYKEKRIKYKGGLSISFDDTSRIIPFTVADVILKGKFDWKPLFLCNGTDSELNAGSGYIEKTIISKYEIGNHTVNHIDWKTYLQTHPVEEFYNEEIAPLQTSMTNIFGITPTVYGYCQVCGHNVDLDTYLLEHGFTHIRVPLENMIDHNVSDICYDGSTGQIIYSLDLGSIPDGTAGDSTILSYLEYAKNNNVVVSFTLHTVSLTDANSSQIINIARLRLILQYVIDNNMTNYTISELVPSLFGL